MLWNLKSIYHLNLLLAAKAKPFLLWRKILSNYHKWLMELLNQTWFIAVVFHGLYLSVRKLFIMSTCVYSFINKIFYVSQKHVFIPLTHHILRIRSKEISILEKRYTSTSIFLHYSISMLGKNETLLMVLLILY